MRFSYLIASALGLAVAAQAHAAPVAVKFDDYDSTFSSRCGGTACEQAVGEFRNGDNGGVAEAIGTLGRATVVSGDQIRLNAPGFWGANDVRKFSFAHDGAGNLSLVLDLDADGDLGDEIDDGSNSDAFMSFFASDIDDTQTMWIRATSNVGSADTVLSGLTLNGTALGDLTGDSVADYLRVSGIDFGAAWTLMGFLSMDGNSANPNARPSVQFKLTELPVPVPGAALLFLPVAGFLATRRRRG